MFLVLPQPLLRWWDGAWGLFLRMLTSNPVALSRLLYGAVQSLSSEEGTSARRLQWLTKKLCGPRLVCLQKYLLANLHDCQHFGEICFADRLRSIRANLAWPVGCSLGAKCGSLARRSECPFASLTRGMKWWLPS